jgi:glyoxylate reductase
MTRFPDVRVIVSRRLPLAVEHRLTELFACELNADDHAMSASELSEAAARCDVLVPTVSDRIDSAVIHAGSGLRLIANYGVGFNHIDLGAARDRGIIVSNTPDVLTEDTADFTIAAMLMIARRCGEGERELRRGAWTGWRPTHLLGTRVHGRTLGIIGMGRIGRAVARRAKKGFGMTILYHDHRRRYDIEREIGAEWCESVEDLLRRSDFVSLHTPSTPETRGLIDAERLSLMRQGAFLINTARGDLVDEAALVAALRSGGLAGAALDVYANEPSVDGALLSLENVVLLPHLGSATTESREAMGMRVVENVVAWRESGKVLDPVGERV